jgi:L-aspartate oxidase
MIETNCPVVIGAGLAGLTVALSLSNRSVIVLSSGELGGESSSAWAQGGIAAAIGGDDSATLHSADTVSAGGGICDPEVVRLVTADGPAVINRLIALGVPFDRAASGYLMRGLEAAHSRRRIVHAGGDGTGQAIMRTFVEAVRRAPSIKVIEHAVARQLLIEGGEICGVVFERHRHLGEIATDRVVLATGGAGALWRHCTNPLGSWGSGIALAARAGAVVADLEFVQFHPTAIDTGCDPMPLASEALRGEGATLINDRGERFMESSGRAELEPRDIVARAIWAEIAAGRKTFLDARDSISKNFSHRFPTIYAHCQAAGIDPARAPIPVRPAAHYHMGGIATDARGRTSVLGLWAVGEVASTGLHGANRLASNSLLEAASFGCRVAADIAQTPGRHTGQISSTDDPVGESPRMRETVRSTMSAHVDVLRDDAGLKEAVRILAPLVGRSDMALAGFLIAWAALLRTESRGSHARTDYPERAARWERRQFLSVADIAPELVIRKNNCHSAARATTRYSW